MDEERLIVETEYLKIPVGEHGFILEKGGKLAAIDVAFERYGKLSPKKDNVVLICHALTGDAHAAGFFAGEDKKPGWWDYFIGPGKAVDTNFFHVICSNFLGGCKGTTGPNSINPATQKPYGIDFPEITIKDMVSVQKLFLENLGISRVYAIIGGSAGAFQVLEWCVTFPDFMEKAVCIAGAESLSTQGIAFDIVARQVIQADPDWNSGEYYDKTRPGTGLSLARMIGHITYLSRESMGFKFGRKRQNHTKKELFNTDFEVESYLTYQGQKFVERFDANSYLYITQAMNSFSLRERAGSLEKLFEPCNAEFLVISISSDWLYPAEQSRDLAEHLLKAEKKVTYCNLDSPYGHDSFLIENNQFSKLVYAFLKPGKDVKENGIKDFEILSGFIDENRSVLDLGCGQGNFLYKLKKAKKTRGLGIDIDFDNITQCNNREVPAFQVNLDEGLKMILDDSYDYSVLSNTLYEVRHPDKVLNEMLRVSKAGIVAFANFASWACRFRLGLLGLLPESKELPYKWYNSPNAHYLTLKDFKMYCKENNIEILELKTISGGLFSKILSFFGFKNAGADRIIAKITKKHYT